MYKPAFPQIERSLRRTNLRDEDRRKELGKMFMDVAKFLATGGLISGILTNKLTFLNGLVIIAIVVSLGSLAYFTVPPKSGG